MRKADFEFNMSIELILVVIIIALIVLLVAGLILNLNNIETFLENLIKK